MTPRPVSPARNRAHDTHLIVVGCMDLVLDGLLYRLALIPRALAAFGLLAVTPQITAVSLPPLGRPIVLPRLLPMARSHLALDAETPQPSPGRCLGLVNDP